MNEEVRNIYRFKVKALAGGEIDFAEYKDKKILIVNTASECGFTPQYAQLQELYDSFAGKLVVVGFPSNDFGGQEPGSNEEIKGFCDSRFHVTFPMASKIKVKGDEQHPLYQWLTHKEQNGKLDSEVKWNFHKFLIDEKGELIGSFSTVVDPLDEQILNHLT